MFIFMVWLAKDQVLFPDETKGGYINYACICDDHQPHLHRIFRLITNL